MIQGSEVQKLNHTCMDGGKTGESIRLPNFSCCPFFLLPPLPTGKEAAEYCASNLLGSQRGNSNTREFLILLPLNLCVEIPNLKKRNCRIQIYLLLNYFLQSPPSESKTKPGSLSIFLCLTQEIATDWGYKRLLDSN